MRISLFPKFQVSASLAILLFPVTIQAQQTITGQAAFADYTKQEPGLRRKITVADLPEPKPSESVDNGPHCCSEAGGCVASLPQPASRFSSTRAAMRPLLCNAPRTRRRRIPPTSGTFVMPRIIHTAPNGDLFVADSQAGSILILRGVTSTGKAASVSTFATGLDHPFGIAFYPAGANPQWIYVGNATTVVRFPYNSGDLKATQAPETIVPDLPGYAQLRGRRPLDTGCCLLSRWEPYARLSRERIECR